MARYQMANRVAVNAHERSLLYKAQSRLCYICRRKMRHPNGDRRARSVPADKATVDHVFPLSHGGFIRIGNVLLACNTCNRQKGNRFPNKKEMASLIAINWLLDIDTVMVDPRYVRGIKRYQEMMNE